MTRLTTPRVFTAASAALLLSSLSFDVAAAPVDDLRRGTHVLVRGVYANVRGEPLAANYMQLTKAADSLDLVVTARSLGIDFDATFHLSATVEGNRVTWTVDETPATPWDLGGGVSVNRVRGKLVGEVNYVGGGLASDCGGLPCNYSVTIDAHPSTYIDVYGESPNPWLLGLVNESFVEHIASPNFHLYAGVANPPLAGFELAVPNTRFCTATTLRRYSGQVRLATAPSRGGTWVDLLSSDPDRLSTRRVFVREGRTSGRFAALFPPDYSGTLMFRAAAGGVMQSLTVSVEACLPSIDRRYVIDTLIGDLYGSAGPLSDVQINDRGDSLARAAGKWHGAAADGKAVSLDAVLGYPVLGATLNPLGDLLLRAEAAGGKEVAAHVHDFGGSAEELIWLGEFTPSFAHESGTSVGLCPNGPCLFNGNKFEALPLDPKAAPTDVSHSGVFIGNALFGSVQQGVWTNFDKGGSLGSLGGHSFVAALNESGDAVGWSETTQGLRTAVIYPAKDWSKPKALSLPQGLKRSEAVGIAEDGSIVVNAELLDGSMRAYLAHGDLGGKALDELVDTPDVSVHEALSISMDGLIVARGKRAGKPELFVLRQK